MTDEHEVRRRALELAIERETKGAEPERVLSLANKFADFMFGKYQPKEEKKS